MAKLDPVNYHIILPEDFYAFMGAAIDHAREARNIRISKRRVCLASGLSHATMFEAEKRNADLRISTIVRCCTVLGYEIRLVKKPEPRQIAEYDEAIRERPGARKKRPTGGHNFPKKITAPV
jgi:hypothetical protein